MLFEFIKRHKAQVESEEPWMPSQRTKTPSQQILGSGGVRNKNNVLAFVETVKIMKANPYMSKREATMLACDRVEGSFFNTVYLKGKKLRASATEAGLLGKAV